MNNMIDIIQTLQCVKQNFSFFFVFGFIVLKSSVEFFVLFFLSEWVECLTINIQKSKLKFLVEPGGSCPYLARYLYYSILNFILVTQSSSKFHPIFLQVSSQPMLGCQLATQFAQVINMSIWHHVTQRLAILYIYIYIYINKHMKENEKNQKKKKKEGNGMKRMLEHFEIKK